MSLEHIHPDFRHIVGLSTAERLAFLQEDRWVSYPRAEQILGELKTLVNMPIKVRMPNLLIVGDPSNGKTSLARRFWKLYGEGYVNDDGEAVKPIILTEAPPSADEKGLHAAILEPFFVSYRVTDPVVKLRYQVIHLMRACHARILVIDEFHSLLTGSAIKQREVMNVIKLLCNQLAIPIVGFGTRDAVRVLHTDPQHASRFEVASLPKWNLDREFQTFLAGYEKVLPLKQPSKLFQPELASLLHAISGGVLGKLSSVLARSAATAITSGKEQIDKAIIEANAKPPLA